MATTAQKRASAARRAANRARARNRDHARVRARPIFSGRSGKITRRCAGRQLLLTPDKAGKIANFVGYCLAYAANMYRIQVHASVWMSNHHHTDITDPDGNIVAFKQLLHSLVARGINALHDRNDHFWSADPPCDTRRPTDDESLRDLVYTLTNPVDAGLVKWSRLWLGFTTYGWSFGETRVFKRPDWFFDKDGDMPKKVSLTLVRPPIFAGLEDAQVYRMLMDAVRARELEIQARMREQNRRFMGPEKVAQQHWKKVPKSFEERFTVTPKVASSNKWLLLVELQRDREWEREYAVARERMLAGKPAVFPAGTYWLRRFANVNVAAQPP